VIKKTTPQSVQAHPRPPTTQPKALPTDLSVLLLHAADEYINAARSIGPTVAMIRSASDLQSYYKLMATGLGCMEAVLKNYNHTPRDQAALMLRYASLLIEETDNHVEIEEVLSKGVCMTRGST
jgi:hypothetical protein